MAVWTVRRSGNGGRGPDELLEQAGRGEAWFDDADAGKRAAEAWAGDVAWQTDWLGGPDDWRRRAAASDGDVVYRVERSVETG